MGKINLPGEVLNKETFKTLPAKEKEEYMNNLIRTLLQLNPEGITITQIKEATNFTYSTIWHHLEVLNCTAQANKISRGNLDVYYPTGSYSSLNDYKRNKATYEVGLVKNNENRLISIREKRENRLGNYIVCRGVEVPLELANELITALTKAKKADEKEKSRK